MIGHDFSDKKMKAGMDNKYQGGDNLFLPLLEEDKVQSSEKKEDKIYPVTARFTKPG